MTKAIFLDRDGVINNLINDHGHLRSPRTVGEFSYTPGIDKFIDSVRDLGFEVIVVTNQPEVKRGLVRKEVIDAFHEKIRHDLGIQNIFVCWHDENDFCECRKPRPGLLLQAAAKLTIDLKQSFMIGDREKDYIAAINAGCQGVLYGNLAIGDIPVYADFNSIINHLTQQHAAL